MIVKAFVKYIIKISKDYVTKTFEREDVIAEAMKALVKAIDTFDFEKKYVDYVTEVEKPIPFLTYASKCMKNEILMAAKKANRYEEHYICTLNEPAFGDTSGVDKLSNYASKSDEIEDLLEISENKDIMSRLHKTVNTVLKDKERDVILARYYSDENEVPSGKEVGEMFGYSQSYASRIERSATKKLASILDLDL